MKLYRVRYDRKRRDIVNELVWAHDLDEAVRVALGRAGVTDVAEMGRTITLPLSG
jgi:hypothetical protein